MALPLNYGFAQLWLDLHLLIGYTYSVSLKEYIPNEFNVARRIDREEEP